MTRKRFAVIVVAVLIGGFLGGVASDWLFQGTPAFAQRAVPKKLAAESFVLVDASGNTCAVLGMYKAHQPPTWQAPYLALYDGRAKLRAKLALTPTGDAGLVMFDGRGKTAASLGPGAVGMDAQPSP